MQQSWQHCAVTGTLVLPFLSRTDAPDMFAKFEVWKKLFLGWEREREESSKRIPFSALL